MTVRVARYVDYLSRERRGASSLLEEPSEIEPVKGEDDIRIRDYVFRGLIEIESRWRSMQAVTGRKRCSQFSGGQYRRVELLSQSNALAPACEAP
jgi:hypothetical protein